MELAFAPCYALLKRGSAAVSALTKPTEPVVGVLGAIALVGERPGLLDGLGSVVVLSAAASMTWQVKKRTVHTD